MLNDDQKPISPKDSVHYKGGQREMQQIHYESSREYNQSNRRTEDDVGFQQIIEEYDMNNI